MKDDESLEKYNKTLNKVSNSTKKGSDSERVYNEKYLKNKIKSYKGEISTNFCDDRIPKEDSHCICLSVILLDSVFKMGKMYYPQVILEELLKTKRLLDILLMTQKLLLMNPIKNIKKGQLSIGLIILK